MHRQKVAECRSLHSTTGKNNFVTDNRTNSITGFRRSEIHVFSEDLIADKVTGIILDFLDCAGLDLL